MLHSIASNDHVGGVSGAVFGVVEKAADLATTHYVAGSDAIALKFADKKLASADKITRIHYSLDLERFERETLDQSMRSVLGARTEADVVVALVGRLERQKGVEYLLEAVAEISGRCPRLRVRNRRRGFAAARVGTAGAAFGRSVSSPCSRDGSSPSVP